MTERLLPPEPEAFAAVARMKMRAEGRKWSWLSRETGINVNTLRSQIITNPSSLKLGTSRRVASALGIDQWGDAA